MTTKGNTAPNSSMPSKEKAKKISEHQNPQTLAF